MGINYGSNEDKNGYLTFNNKQITNTSSTLGVYHALNKFVNLACTTPKM